MVVFFAIAGVVFVVLRAFGREGADGLLGEGGDWERGVAAGWSWGRGLR